MIALRVAGCRRASSGRLAGSSVRASAVAIQQQIELAQRLGTLEDRSICLWRRTVYGDCLHPGSCDSRHTAPQCRLLRCSSHGASNHRWLPGLAAKQPDPVPTQWRKGACLRPGGMWLTNGFSLQHTRVSTGPLLAPRRAAAFDDTTGGRQRTGNKAKHTSHRGPASRQHKMIQTIVRSGEARDTQAAPRRGVSKSLTGDVCSGPGLLSEWRSFRNSLLRSTYNGHELDVSECETRTFVPYWAIIFQERAGAPTFLFVSSVPVGPGSSAACAECISPQLAVLHEDLNFSDSDFKSDGWHSFLIGVIGELAVNENEMQWPNQVIHGERTRFNLRSIDDLVRFLADAEEEEIMHHLASLRRISTDRGSSDSWCWDMLRTRWGTRALSRFGLSNARKVADVRLHYDDK